MMGSDLLGDVGDIRQQLNEAKQSLVVLNENIRRFAGRGPKDIRNDKQRPLTETKRTDTDRDWKTDRPEISKRKRRDAKSAFNRLSASTLRTSDVNDMKPRINSRVIREMPTREEIVEAQGTDSESKARNRRMFGSLLGTLQKFCQEESRLKQKEEKKAIIEKKLEEQEIQERECLKKERESLFFDRRKKQLEIKKLEIKMRRLKDFKVWEDSMLQYKQCIRTKTKPHIYYKPRVMSSRLDHQMAKHKAEIANVVVLRREVLHKELIEIENINDLVDGDNNMEDISNSDLCTNVLINQYATPQEKTVNGLERVTKVVEPA